jgi:3-deoxy-D-manno-octulosonic-acid transferase
MGSCAGADAGPDGEESAGFARVNPLVRIPYEGAALLASGATRLAPQRESKLWRSLRGRVGAADRLVAWAATRRDKARPLVWMHAASVGEGLMARPVLDLLRQRIPELQIACTFFSPSAARFAATVPADVADYLPFDTSFAANRLLDALAPNVLVFSKLDIWPLLVEAAARRGVGIALTSATVSPASGRMSWPARLVLGDAYRAIHAAGAVDEASARRLATLGVRADRIEVTGDVRYDQAWERSRSPGAGHALIAQIGQGRPTLVAGSTWAADEARLLPAWRTVREALPAARLVIAAHEPVRAHTEATIAWASAAGLSAAALDDATPTTDVVVVDRVGVLADLYAVATAAYVGGGFHGAGLHSLVEPAAHGVPVVFGPRGADVRDALALTAAGGGFVAGEASAIAERVGRLLRDPAARAAAGEAARRVIRSGLGAAERSAALVQRLL